MAWRRSDSILVGLALKVLAAAAYRSSKEAVGTIEVRLSLRVLAKYIGPHEMLTLFWEQATVMPRHPWTSCHSTLRGIEQALIAIGYSAHTAPEER